MRTFDINRVECLPEEMTSRNQWVLWRIEDRDGKPTKVPVSVTGGAASSTNPRTWASFDEVVEAYERDETVSGIGFVFSEHDGLVGVDLDKASNGNGLPAAWAAEHINAFQTYVEVSPSGNGYHIIGKAKLQDGQGRKKDKIEIYDRGRYFTVTGRIFNPNMTEVRPVQEVVDTLVETHFGSKRVRGMKDWANINVAIDADRTPPLDKYEALKEADSRFRQSVERKRTDMKDSSPSAYDMSLASLAVRAGWNNQEIADLLVYVRMKHDDDLKRKDYYQRTIHNARIQIDIDEAVDTLGTMAGDPETGLQAIKTITNLNIKKIIQDGKRNSDWIVEFEDGERHIMGNTSEVCSKAKWEGLVMEMRAGVLGKITKKQWESFKLAVQSIAILEDNSQTAFHVWLEDNIDQYLEGAHGDPVQEGSEDFEEAFRQARPFISSEGSLHVSAESLRRYLFQGGEKVDRRKIYSGLRALGYENIGISKRVEGRVIKRNYWRFPI